MEIQRRCRRSVTPLPDDVLTEILRRIPAHDLLKCRSVCRRWRDLISTQHFQEMHLKAKAHHSSMILVQMFVPIKNKGALLLLDKWEKPRQRPTIRRARANFIDNSGSSLIEVQLSYDGLIVIRSSGLVNGSWGFSIFNPISRDAVRIETSNSGFNVYGIFFNPLIKEYCILLGNYGSESDVEFQILNLGGQPCCRALKQPVSFLHKPRNPSSEPPVVIDDATIYWLVDCLINHSPSCTELIMSFDIKTEEFTFMPHPGPIDDCQGLEHEVMHLIKIEGSLSVAQSIIACGITLLNINIWTLKDSAARLWTKTHSVSIDVNIYINVFTRYSAFVVMAVGNGELLLHYSDFNEERLYAYNLELGTVKKIGKTYQDTDFSIFVPSFVSLRNCQPIIRI